MLSRLFCTLAILFLSIVFALPSTAQFESFEQVSTPAGTDFGTGLRYDPNVAGILYATAVARFSRNTIYKSEDNAASWFPLLRKDSQGRDVLVEGLLAVHPTQANTIFVLGIQGDFEVIKSTDGGQSWTTLSSGFSAPGFLTDFFVVDPNPETIFAQTTLPTELYKSTNFGVDWEKVTPKTINPDAPDLAGSCEGSPADQLLLICPGFGGLAVSYDLGESWSTLDIPSPVGFAVGLSNTDPNYVAYSSSDGETGIWISFDQGETWEKTSEELVGPLEVSRADSNIVFAQTGDEAIVYISTDKGNTWTVSRPEGLPFQSSNRFDSTMTAAVPSPWNPSDGFVGTQSTGIWKTDDLGATWQKASEGLIAGIFNFTSNTSGLSKIDSLVSPTRTFRRETGSDDWQHFANVAATIPLSVASPFINDPLDDSIVTQNSRLSLDGGFTWKTREYFGTTKNTMLPIPGTEARELLMRLGPRDVGVEDLVGSGLAYSSDQGLTWELVATDEAVGAILNRPRVAVRTNSDSVIYAIGGAIPSPPANWKISRSDDNGTSWSILDGPPLIDEGCFGCGFFEVIPKPLKGEHVFLRTSEGIFRSDDAGETWNEYDPLGIGGFSLIEVSRRDPNVLIAQSSNTDRVYYSLDDGESWKPLEQEASLIDGGTVHFESRRINETIFDDVSGRIILDVVGLGHIASKFSGLSVSVDNLGAVDFSMAGESIPFAATVSNSSGSIINDVRAELREFGELPCTAQQVIDLAPAELISCEGTYIVKQRDVDQSLATLAVFGSGEVQNLTRLTSVGTSTISGLSLPDSSMSWEVQDGNLYTTAGEFIQVQLFGRNTGNVTLDELTLDAGDLAQSGFCEPNQFQPEFRLNPKLAPGEELICLFEHIVTEADIAAGEFAGNASFSARAPSDELVQSSLSFSVPAGEPALAASPEALDFGEITVGAQSGSVRVQVTNIRDSVVPIQNVAILVGQGSRFLASGNTCSGSLAMGRTCGIDVVFSPDTDGPAAWDLIINYDSGDGELSIPLDGTGTSSTVPSTFFVGGSVSGLSGTGLVLQNNLGNALPILSNVSFVFGNALADGSAYDVTVASQPTNPDQTCSVNNGDGVLSGANVNNVEISCTTESFTVGGTVSGLAGSGLVLQNNLGDSLSIVSNGSFVFGTALTDGSEYDVTVASQPSNPAQTCSVNNGAGGLSGANVTNVEVVCTTDSFTVGGTVTGLDGTGLVLQNNLGDDLSIASNGGFVFDTALPDGSTYDVTVLRDPISPDQICTVENGSGVLSGANEQNVEVTCMADPDYIFIDSFEVRP